MLIGDFNRTVTPSSGDIAINTQDLRGMCRQIVVKPATGTTMYDISVTNNRDAVVYERTDEQGTLSELLELPLLGVYQVSVANATRDEAFLIQLMIEE